MSRDEVIIEAGRADRNYWRDLWRYRELFYFFAWRDILVRYKQTVVGVAWAVIRPLMTIGILTVVFNKVAHLQGPAAVPYALLVCAGMLPWQFFSTALSEAGNSLVGNAHVISKVYFPRLIVPAGSVITSFVDFLITLVIMAGMMACYGFLPDWRILFLPIFAGLAFCAAFGAGLWLSAVNVKYRDFRYVLPFVVQFGVYVSPVGFSTDSVPERWRLLFSFNPMVGVIDGFRWSLLRGHVDIWWPGLLVSGVFTVLLVSFGLWYFRRTERFFADVV